MFREVIVATMLCAELGQVNEDEQTKAWTAIVLHQIR